MCAYRKAILTIGMQLHAMSLRIIWSVSIRLINKCQSGFDFIFTSERKIYSSFMKISVPSPVIRGKTPRWKWNFAKFTRSNVNKGMRFASGTIKSASFDTLERQRLVVNKYASTFPMASCNKKRCNHKKKKWRKKNMKVCNCYCKYAIEDNQFA